MTPEEIQSRFSYHPPQTAERGEAHAHVREHCRTLADILNEVLPEGREQKLAISKLEEVMFWANASIARGV